MTRFATLCFLSCTLASSEVVLRSSSKINDDLFLNWFHENGGTTNGIHVADCDDQGRGIVALANISQDQEVMYIPPELIFSTPNLISSRDPLNIKITKLLPSEDDAVTASLLLESWRNDNSFFAPYLRVLPSYVASLLHFSEEELSELQDKEFENEIRIFKLGAKKSYNNLISSVESIWPQSAIESVTYEKYLWAVTIINSRGLRFRGKVYLSPLADMFNYAPHPVRREADSGEFFLLHHKLSDGTDNKAKNSKNSKLNENNNEGPSLTVYADRPLLAGKQLPEDYGDNSDKIYLQYHGFVPDENPFRCVVLTGPRVPSTASPMLLKLLDLLQFPGGKPPSKCMDSTGRLGRSLEVYLSALSFSEASLESCTAVMKGQGPMDSKYWSNVMTECGFKKISERIAVALKSPTLNLKDNLFNTISNTKTSMEKEEKHSERTDTAMKYLQAWMKDSGSSFPTSLTHDKSILSIYEMNAKQEIDLNVSIESQEPVVKINKVSHSNAHKLLALKNRINQKILLGKLFHIFGLDYAVISDMSCGKKLQELRDGETGGITDDETISQIGENSFENSTERSSEESSEHSSEPSFVSLQSDNIIPLGEKIDLFNKWFLAANPPVAKIKAIEMTTVRIGTIATEDIKSDDVYLQIPLGVIMDSASAAEDPTFGALINSLRKTYKQKDDFHELLFFLLHERLVRHVHSKYWPYIRLLPGPGDTDPPTGWSVRTIRERLKPSYIATVAETHRNRTEGTYGHIKNVKEIVAFFPEGMLTFEVYQWAAAVLDSRSIWWEGIRHLVPMLDFINCAEGPDPSRVHSTQLEAVRGEKHAVTKAGWDFKAGEQLFENYGQPNHIYFTYHGFTLDPGSNTHDCVHFDFKLSAEDLKNIPWESENVRAVSQVIGLRNKAVHTVCLKETIPAGVWLFLSLKTTKKSSKNRKQKNNVIVHPKFGEYSDQPTLETKNFLLSLIEERLVGYELHETAVSDARNAGRESKETGGSEGSELVHGASIAFLKSEKAVLQSVKEAVQVLKIRSYDDDNDEL